MQIAEPCPACHDTSSQGSDAPDGVESRLERILRVHRIAPPLAGPRERDFWQIVGSACEASGRGDPKAIASANIALDLLSLELCDE
jgi:hypothetical protein